jgi:hypothetical protein
MNTIETEPGDADGLDIFDDVREVTEEAPARTALQVVIAVLGYTLALAIVVVLLVKTIELLWPVVLFMVIPAFVNLILTLG